MSSTYSPYSKPFIALKVILVPSLLGFIQPVLGGWGMTEKSDYFTSTHNIIAGTIVFLLEVFFIFGAGKLNSLEISKKLQSLNDQIGELESLKLGEQDAQILVEIEKDLRKLKKERITLTAT